MVTDNDRTPPDAAVLGHEERDVALRPVVAAAIGLAVVIVLVVLGMRGLLGYYIVRGERTSPPANPLAATAGQPLPPEPRLQTHPRRDLHELRASEDAVLNTYGWVDRQSGVVRIPIDRAMALLAERGLAATQGGGAP